MSERPQDLGGFERVKKVLGAMELYMNMVPGFRRGHARGVKMPVIPSAVAPSSGRLTAMMPPKADTLSHSNAA